MKKLYTTIALVAISYVGFSQAIPGAGMEAWRSSTAGSTAPKTIHAPNGWVSEDSLLIADGEAFGSFIGAGSNFHAQVFPETTIVHSGTYSAKLITLKQDTLGLTPGAIENFKTSVNVSVLLSGGSMASATTFSGGLAITARMYSVSGWVQYFAGTGGTDTGTLNVSVFAHIGSIDSMIGRGNVNIFPTSSWQQVTANITYTDSVHTPDTIRINFASSRSGNVDSSTLYVDDVTMSSIDGVETTLLTNEIADVFPNPAKGVINLTNNSSVTLKFSLINFTGQSALSHDFTGKETVDLTSLPGGMYFYLVSDASGNIVTKGKLVVLQ